MARVTPVEGRKAPLLLRLLNWVSRRMLGREAMPFKIMAHNPGFLLPFLLMSRFTQGKIQLDHHVRLLATYLVAEINQCPWCIDFGRAEGQRRGMAEKLTAVRDYARSPVVSPAERAALAFADEMTQVGARVSDETFAELRRHFSEREIVELAAAVATGNFYNRINIALEVEAQGFCALPTVLATERVAA
jgi:AhpD family alkylhydroperoxidase